MKKVKVGDLPAVGRQIALNHLKELIVLEFADSPPRCRLTTPWFLTKAGYCRVTYSIVGPVAEKPEDNLPFSRREAQDILKEITDVIKPLIE